MERDSLLYRYIAPAGLGKTRFRGNASLSMCRPLRGWERGEDSLFPTGMSPLRGWGKPGFGGECNSTDVSLLWSWERGEDSLFYRYIAPTGLGKTRFRGGTQVYRYTAPTGLKNRTGFFALPIYRPYGAGKEERIPCSYRYTDPAGLGKRSGFPVLPI